MIKRTDDDHSTFRSGAWRGNRTQWSCRDRQAFQRNPRLANRLLKRVRDFAQVKYNGVITYDVACFALDLLEVDQYGLDKTDRRILQTLILNFQGGPVGLETLAASIGEDSGTLEDVYEPYLLQTGFLNRTPRGRMASVLAYTHLGYPRPDLSTK